MKHTWGRLSFIVILLYLTACRKTAASSINSESADISGKWNLVSDTTFYAVGGGFASHPVDYAGEAGDFFDFSSNGSLFTKEGFVLNTLSYRMVSGGLIIISDFGLISNGVQDTSTVTGLTVNNGTAQTIVIESPFDITPGGEFWRKVTLSR